MLLVEHGGSGSKSAAPIAKKVIKKVLERHSLRESIKKFRGNNIMFRPGSIQSHLTLRDKIFSLDLILFFSILILGIISFFVMYSTDWR